MQCWHCATEVAESANFCQNCGAARDGSGALVAMSKAISLEIEGRIGRALVEMEKVVEDFPGGATFTYFGQLQLFRGDLPAAIQAFENALKDNPLHTRALFNLGLAWMRTGKTRKAIDHFKRVLNVDEDFHLARYWLGLLYMNSADLESAQHTFHGLLRKTPSYRIVHYHLGSIALQMADYKTALAEFELMREYADDDALVHFSIGITHYRMGNYLAAKEALQETLSLQPEHNKARNYLEDCDYELGTLL
jgi:tetratricopeptide (TPR) repeat protein